MFGLGFGEMLIVGLVALIAVGPKRLPGMAKALGRGVNEFRNAMDEMKATVYREVQQPMQQAMDQKQEVRETSSEYLDRLLAQREQERADTEAKANEIYAQPVASAELVETGADAATADAVADGNAPPHAIEEAAEAQPVAAASPCGAEEAGEGRAKS